MPKIETPKTYEEDSELKALIDSEKQFLKKSTALISKDDESADFFKEQKKDLQTAETLVDDLEKQTLIYYQYVNLRNKITFLLFRTNKLSAELEAEFKKLSPIEDVAKMVEESAKPRTETQNKLKEELRKQNEAEQRLDIFKAVCNGMSVEQAKEQLEAYEKQIRQATLR